jgi:PAS domain S-box-containing protein
VSLLMRVVLIIAAALLPPLLMQAFNEAALRSAQRAEVRAQALRDAQAVAAEIDAIVGGVRNALVATAANPSVRAADGATCAARLQSVFEDLSFLRALTLVGDDGGTICTAGLRGGEPPTGDTAAVQLARARGEFALGGYTLDPVTGRAELPVAYPVRGARGPGPVLVGEIDLSWLHKRLSGRLLPYGASVTVTDWRGTVLVGVPDSSVVGFLAPDRERAVLAAGKPAIWQERDGGGIDRVFAAVPPAERGADVLVSVGLSTHAAFAAADAAAARSYALIGSGFIAALALAAWMARGTIARPVHAILAVTSRWQGGDTTARVPATEARSEFGRIAAAVNQLLDAVAAGQARLHERLAELRAVYDGAPVGLGYVGRDLRYITVNARLAEINARSAEAHRGRTVWEILPGTAHRIEPLLARALAGEAISSVEVEGETEATPGVPRRLLVSYQPAVGPGGQVLGIVIAIQEITELRRAEEALRAALERTNAELERRVAERTRQFEAEVREREAAQAQLQQAQKMEVIGQLTGGVAHDFNNLLTALIGNLELAIARSRDRPEVVRLLEGAMRSADRGAALTQRMLAFGRRQFLRFQPVNIPALVEGMVELLARTIGPSIRIAIDAAAGLRPARADPNQVELVILNLVVNARDAMPNGGTVTIAIAEEHVGEAAAHPAGLAPGDYVRIAVSDTGTGMDPEILARAFEPFFTTKPVGRGSGLGLPMVHGVAAQSEGGVAINSVRGQGTTVTVWLPCAEMLPLPASASDLPGAEESTCDFICRGRSVLLVDDDGDVADFAATCLKEAGYTVRCAGSGEEALSLLRCAPPPDLMIADLGMPGMSGLQLAAAARRLHPHLNILIATGYTQEDAGVDETLNLPVLGKPFKAIDLVNRVAELLCADPARAERAAEPSSSLMGAR